MVELDRPDALNAFNQQMFDDLADVFIEAAADPDARVVLLTGAGKVFTAGADLKEMGRKLPTPKHGLAGLLDAIIDFPKPFVLAVNGVGAGIGATICGLADLVFIAEGARLRCPFSTLGITAEVASTYTFPQIMGHQRAMWWLMAAEWMSSADAVEAGLALEAVPDAELRERSMAQAAKLAALPTASLTMTKSLIMAPKRELLKAAVQAELAGLAELGGGPANREALAAFGEKREPDFTGL